MIRNEAFCDCFYDVGQDVLIQYASRKISYICSGISISNSIVERKTNVPPHCNTCW